MGIRYPHRGAPEKGRGAHRPTVTPVNAPSPPHRLSVIVKAAAGRRQGMEVVHNGAALLASVQITQTGAVPLSVRMWCLEKCLQKPPCREIPGAGGRPEHAIHLGGAGCHLQRRHQKVEEAPAPGIPDDIRNQVAEARQRLHRDRLYRGAGLHGFLYEDGG